MPIDNINKSPRTVSKVPPFSVMPKMRYTHRYHLQFTHFTMQKSLLKCSITSGQFFGIFLDTFWKLFGPFLTVEPLMDQFWTTFGPFLNIFDHYWANSGQFLDLFYTLTISEPYLFKNLNNIQQDITKLTDQTKFLILSPANVIAFVSASTFNKWWRVVWYLKTKVLAASPALPFENFKYQCIDPGIYN